MCHSNRSGKTWWNLPNTTEIKQIHSWWAVLSGCRVRFMREEGSLREAMHNTRMLPRQWGKKKTTITTISMGFDTEYLLVSIMGIWHMDFAVSVTWENMIFKSIRTNNSNSCGISAGQRDSNTTSLVQSKAYIKRVQVFLYLHLWGDKTRLLLICQQSMCHDTWVKVSQTFQLLHLRMRGCSNAVLCTFVIAVNIRRFIISHRQPLPDPCLHRLLDLQKNPA